MTKQEEINKILHGVALKVIQPSEALQQLSDLGLVLKVERELHGQTVNCLFDAMSVIELDDCKKLIKQSLKKAGYETVESLVESLIEK